MHSSRARSNRMNQLTFFPRVRRARTPYFARHYSLIAFKDRDISPPRPRRRKQPSWACLFPMWMRQGANWLVQRFSGGDVKRDEEHLMSGAELCAERRYSNVEEGWEDEWMWEDRPSWDSVDGRRVELGLA